MNSLSSSKNLPFLVDLSNELPLCPKDVYASRATCMSRALNALVLLPLIAAFAIVAFGQGRETVVAVVNGRSITQGEVDDSALNKIFALQQQLFALRKAALDNLISRNLLETEASRRQVSVDQLKRRMLEEPVSVSPAQVEELYTENIGVFALMSPDEAKEKLRLDLESQARLKRYREELEKLRAEANIQLLLSEPRLPAPKASRSASKGPTDAQVVITEFSDFQCPYCKVVQPVLKEVLQRYPNQVRLDFKHLPLEQHPAATISAQAAFCGSKQGAFWPYHDALFASDELSKEFLDRTANALGLNLDSFRMCLASQESRMAVMADLQEARRLGITSTPTFLINGKLIRGVVALEQFKAAIDHELRAPQIGTHGQP